MNAAHSSVNRKFIKTRNFRHFGRHDIFSASFENLSLSDGFMLEIAVEATEK